MTMNCLPGGESAGVMVVSSPGVVDPPAVDGIASAHAFDYCMRSVSN